MPDENEAKAERDKIIREAYQTATRQLREKYQDEFHKLQQAAAKDKGVDWSPKLNPEQKAEAEARALLDAHPGLRERLLADPAGPAEPDTKVEAGL